MGESVDKVLCKVKQRKELGMLPKTRSAYSVQVSVSDQPP